MGLFKDGGVSFNNQQKVAAEMGVQPRCPDVTHKLGKRIHPVAERQPFTQSHARLQDGEGNSSQWRSKALERSC